MTGVLKRLVDATRERVDAGYYDEDPPAGDVQPAGSFADAIETADPAIVAEIKPSRPTGPARQVDVAQRAQRYAEAGADAISVLTDPDHFDGFLANLPEARGADLPLLMKDVCVAPEQVQAARAWGASAILFIARLPRGGYTEYTMQEAVEDAHEAGLEVLAEVVDEDELDEAIAAGADVVGVNTRDLDTLEVDPDRTRRLLGDRALDVPALHLSGVEGAADVQAALDAGADGVLVGGHLMQVDDPRERLRQLREVRG
jgi:indole-3-glycerol phosphate synthase